MLRLLPFLLSLLLGAASALAQPVASLADGGSGRKEFASKTPRGPSDIMRRNDMPEAIIAGDLTLPPGGERVPAIVLMHGSGGILQGREHDWAARLNALGYATFVVDSFTPRGLRATATDQTRLSTMANVADSLAALKLLATHPRIDAERIAVMGFSRGGQVALYTALEPIRQGMIEGDLRFAAHVALYPSCNIPYRADAVSTAPILMLLGEADDYTPAPPCLAYAEWFKSRGAAVETRVYPGAFHDFDIPQPPRRFGRLQSARNCNAEVKVEAGIMKRLDTGQEMADQSVINAWLRSCMEYGATYGGDAPALAAAQKDIAAFLQQAFGR